MRVAAFIRSRRFGAESSAAVLHKYQINKKLERCSEQGDNTAKRQTLQKNEGLSTGFTSLHRWLAKVFPLPVFEVFTVIALS
ncbi:hypothetical protein MHYP_G00223430 [Metynnis hypsauchen]